MAEKKRFWQEVKDGDAQVVALFMRHYSARPLPKEKYLRYGVTGPGQTMVLLTENADALFVWRLEKFRKDGQGGLNCSVFRNESAEQSSILIKEAVEIARERWGATRVFTFVNERAVKSSNPGCCFKKAGWSACGKTKRGLLIFEENGGTK